MVRRDESEPPPKDISPLVPGMKSAVLARFWPSCAAIWSSRMLCGSPSGGGWSCSLGGDPGPSACGWASCSIRAVS